MYQLEFGIIDNFMNFGGFPITGLTTMEWGTERYPLSTTTRSILSALWYVFLLAIAASIPLCLGKFFKSKEVYQKYKNFWWFGAFIFTSLTAVLIGIVPKFSEHYVMYVLNDELLLFLIFYFITLCVVSLPAYIQYKYYNR